MKKTAKNSKIADWKPIALSLIVIFLLTFIIYRKMFSEMKLYIDDADPYSYVAVIPAMFIITLLFFYRKDLKIESDARKILLAIPLLAVSFILLFEAGSFPEYSLDSLSLPFFIAGCIVLFFSTNTARRLLFPILYLFLLWTPIFYPLVLTQGNLTNITTDVVEVPIRLLGYQIERSGNAFYSGSNVSLEVVSECVSLSSIIALFCFLLPFAYLAKGAALNRLAWLAIWVAGGWLLDVVRIVIVLLIWYYSGVSTALQVFHTLGWNFIFDLILIIALVSIVFFKFLGLELRM